MAKQRITVWGKLHEIDAHQETKNAWKVVGEYLGERIEVTGRTEFAAIRQWQRAAEDIRPRKP